MCIRDRYNVFAMKDNNSKVVYFCKYHVVWCPKYRRKVLTDGIDERLKELIADACSDIDVEILEMDVQPDSVHLLLDVSPKCGINHAVRHIKGFTSRALREEFPALKSRLPTLWTLSYFVATVGDVQADAIAKYIEAQKHV